MRAPHSITGIIITMLITWQPAAAQEQAGEEQQVETKVTPSGEIKIFNDLVIPEGEVRSGAIRVIGGDLTVAGRVTGRITVIGGDVELLPTAQVEGTIVALGGKIDRSDEAQVTGEILEVNRGKFSLTREEAREIFGYDESRDKRLDTREHEDEEDEWVMEEVDGNGPLWQPHLRRRVRPDFEVPTKVTFRYNRSEGVALYFPFHPDTDDIPGFHVYGNIGHAFGANKWYGRLGVGEYLWRGRIGLLVEGYKEPRHDDGWRLRPIENTLSALLIHQDWYDWYEAEGYGGALVLALPRLVELKVRYRNEKHSSMENAADWSLFGGDLKFRPPYEITDTADVNLRYQIALGRPVGYFPRRIQGNLSYAHTRTMPGSEFEYTRDDLTLEAFVPLHRRVGIRVNARTGAIRGDFYGRQHQVPLGGIGSVQGYKYKSIFDDSDNHYAVINAMFSLRTRKKLLSLHWHYGATWENDARLFSAEHFKYLPDHSYHAVGISAGDDDTRIELFKPLKEGRDWVLYLRILDF